MNSFTNICIPFRIALAILLALLFYFFPSFNHPLIFIIGFASFCGLILVTFLHVFNLRTGLAGDGDAWWDRRIEIIFLVGVLLICLSFFFLVKESSSPMLYGIPIIILVDVIIGYLQYIQLK